jgi:ubiquinone/menaquinone biosynthesis C-methylase UbiE
MKKVDKRVVRHLCALMFFGVMMPSFPTPVSAQVVHSHQHSFSGASHWAKIFDDPARDEWQMPHQVIQTLSLKPNSVVADIGAGTGYFTVRLSHMLPNGTIYAVDTEPDMVKYLRDRAQQSTATNLKVVLGMANDPKLPVKVDLALFVDVYHHIQDRVPYIERLKQSLNPHGRVAVIDFRMDAPIGPPPSARVDPQSVKNEFASAGMRVVGQYEFLPNQFFLIFQ